MKQLNIHEIEALYSQAIRDGRVDVSDTAVIFYSRSILSDRLGRLKQSFPETTLHAIAIKANSSTEVLGIIAGEGFGLEAASFEEVLLAEAAGVPYEKIVFDSPVKTRSEIDICHKRMPGLTVNANSLEELERYPADFSGRLGLRINPLVSSDAPKLWDVSGKASKFGVDIRKKDKIIDVCLSKPEVTGLHVHVGSGIKDYNANLEAVRKVIEVADAINEQRRSNGIYSRIEFMDIGGGILFDEMEGDKGLDSFVANLHETTSLFGNFDVITEYGKFIHNDAGFVVSDVEYVLPGTEQNDPSTAFIHVGADLFVRKVYSDLPIEFPYSVIKADGNTKTGTQRYNIAGPLCFAGDILYHDIELPVLEEGDKFVIQRTGANTLSMWSDHCSRKVPKLLVV